MIYVDTGSADTTRRRSKLLWDGFNFERARIGDPGYATLFFDDFSKGVAHYTATQATAGTFALDTSVNYPVALADCNSTTATQGINVQLPGEYFLPAAGQTIIFEARFKFADVATGPEFFIGLHEVDTTIIATSALSGSNMIGCRFPGWVDVYLGFLTSLSFSLMARLPSHTQSNTVAS